MKRMQITYVLRVWFMRPRSGEIQEWDARCALVNPITGDERRFTTLEEALVYIRAAHDASLTISA